MRSTIALLLLVGSIAASLAAPAMKASTMLPSKMENDERVQEEYEKALNSLARLLAIRVLDDDVQESEARENEVKRNQRQPIRFG